MSVLLSSFKKRNLAHKVIRKAGVLDKNGIAQLTKKWTLILDNQEVVLSFSRDNLHVWINKVSAEPMVYISDRGYDVDLFVDYNQHKIHIFSGVEGQKITNYLFIDDHMVGQDKTH